MLSSARSAMVPSGYSFSRGRLGAVGMRGLGVVAGMLLAAGCPRATATPVAPVDPVAPPSAEAPEPVASPPTEAELTPLEVAAYDGGSSNLILKDGALYWETSRMAPAPQAGTQTLQTVPSRGADGAVLDCSRTRGDVWRLALEPDARPQRIAEAPDWPWSLQADDASLYFIGHCRPKLYTVPITGGTPEAIGGKDLDVIGVFPGADGVLVADRFGERPGIYRIGADGAPKRIAGETTQPWLLGERKGVVLWGDRESEIVRVHAVDPHGLHMSVGALSGQPTHAIAHGDHLFVITQQMVAEITPDAITALGNVRDYGDRTNFAVDDAYLYWANGKDGTLTRVGRDGQGQVDAYFGGEPCCVAADGRFVYWLDRRGKTLMRVHRARFDDPPPVPEPEPEAEDPTSGILDAMPGLTLSVKAKLARNKRGWGVQLTGTVEATGDRTYYIHEANGLQLSGHTTHADGTGAGFGGGCASTVPTDLNLRDGDTHVFTRRYPDRDDKPLRRGDKLELDVSLCWVGDDEGRTARVHGGKVVLDLTSSRPTVRVVPHGQASG